MSQNTLWYIDSSLRDGEQAPGVSFCTAEKITIAALLDICGIDELEAGTPAMGISEQKGIRSIVGQGFSFRISVWCRALKKDLDAARQTGAEGVNISFPVSDIHIETLGRSHKWVLSEMKSLVNYASNYFAYVAIGAQDASRAKFNFLHQFLDQAAELPVGRVRIADTAGCHNPFHAHSLISGLLNLHPKLDLEYHAHNDLGMATANTLAAISAGARAVSTTVNGLGERAGNASFDEVVMACRKTLGIKDTINSRFFPYLASYVEQVSGRKISESKPITGRMALCHESGIHASCIMKNPDSYQFLNSTEVGREKPEIVFGKHSGRKAINGFFEERGIYMAPDMLNSLMEQIRLLAVLRKESVRHEELLDIFYRMS